MLGRMRMNRLWILVQDLEAFECDIWRTTFFNKNLKEHVLCHFTSNKYFPVLLNESRKHSLYFSSKNTLTKLEANRKIFEAGGTFGTAQLTIFNIYPPPEHGFLGVAENLTTALWKRLQH